MIKVTELMTRKAGMSVEDFQDYWWNVHGPLVSTLPGIRRYVQSPTKLAGYRNGEPAYDGIAEVWFDDKAALAHMMSTPELATVKADEPNFIDVPALVELVTEEAVIKDGPAPEGGIKSVEVVNLNLAMGPEEAHRYWRDVHGPIAAKIPTMRRYVQSHIRMGAYGKADPPPFDGVAVTWWDDTDGMRASAASPEYAATRADEPNFLGAEPAVILTTEKVVIP